MPDFIPASSRTRQCLSSLYLLFHLVVRFCYLRSVKARQPHSSPLYGVILVFHMPSIPGTITDCAGAAPTVLAPDPQLAPFPRKLSSTYWEKFVKTTLFFIDMLKNILLITEPCPFK